MTRPLAEVGLDLALRSVEQQENRLKEIRTRGGTLVAAASIAASVLGAQATRTETLEPLAGLAILAYVCSVLATLYILLPHKLVLEFRASAVFELAEEHDVSVEEAVSTTAEWIEDFHESNRDELLRLSRWYSAGVVSVGVEIALWTLSIGDNVL